MLKHLAYPILCLSAILTIYGTLHYHWSFSTSSFLFLMGTLLYLSALEQIIPYKRSWNPCKREWLRDGIYLVLTMLGGAFAVPCAIYLATLFPIFKLSHSLVVEGLTTLTLSSLGSYLFHRMTHVQKWFWLLHAVHHRDEKVNVGNNGVNHILDVFGRRMLSLLPGILLGVSPEAIFVVGIISIVQGYFVHANIDVSLGYLNYFVVTPEQHRLHHSRDMDEAGHFSVDFPFWDLVLGTFTWREGRTPRSVGVVNPERYPLPEEYLNSFFYPFRRANKYANKKNHQATDCSAYRD